MAFVSADRVKETSTTTGTGTYSLAGAVTGFRTFVAGVGNGNTCHYVAEDGTDWEIGLGTVTDAAPDTLARTRVIKSSNGDAAVSWAAGTRTIFCAPIASRIRDVTSPKGALWDLTMSNAGGDTTNDIQIEAGEAMDESGEVLMQLTSPITKQIDAAWAVGTAAGGMNTGAVANATWYEVHLIYRQDTGVVDVMFTTTANRATLPTNYTHQRRIGWVRRGTATNLQFTQVGDWFTLTTPINDVAVTKTTTATAVALTVPPNSIARFRASADGNTTVNANSAVLFKENVETGANPALASGQASLGYFDLATCAAGGWFELRVNASSQITHDSEVAQANLDISTFGWYDGRRKLEPI
jgi:hypothetical protein